MSVLASLSGVNKRYGAVAALTGLDLQVRAGEVLAVLGPNGAGKSTAIAILLGLAQPDEGEVRLFGRNPLDVAARRGVGVMMQDVALPPNLTVRELIAQTAAYYPSPLGVDETILLTGLEAIARRRYGKLSGGQKRQAQFALAICGDAPLLFLDEPTANLDIAARETFWEVLRALKAKGVSIVLTTHYIEEAEALADRVVVIGKGRLIVEGSVDEVRKMVSRRRIECQTAVGLDAVLAWPGVKTAEKDGETLRVTVFDAEDVTRRLLAADPALAGLEVGRASLSEAIVKLTEDCR